MGLVEEGLGMVEVAMSRRDKGRNRDEVRVVARRAVEEREQPQSIDPEGFQVRELFAEPLKVAVPVVVGVIKRADV
jgi:hypothetical protein